MSLFLHNMWVSPRQAQSCTQHESLQERLSAALSVGKTTPDWKMASVPSKVQSGQSLTIASSRLVLFLSKGVILLLVPVLVLTSVLWLIRAQTFTIVITNV